MKIEKRLFLAALAGCVSLALTACGSSKDASEAEVADTVSSAYSYSGGTGGSNMAVSAEEAGYPESGLQESADVPAEAGVNAGKSSRKLIRTVHMDVETKEFDLLLPALESRVEELGGYIENMETYNGSSYSGYSRSRYANLTIRIPQENLNAFLDAVSENGNVVSRSESVEDVTLTYVDMESRKNSLLVEQERLLAFLEQAESMEDIITIESRLSQVRYELESMESQLRTYDNQVDYSTVHLSVDEVRELTAVEEKNAWQRMTEGFVDSVKSLGHQFAEICIWFVVNLPFLIVWGALIFLAVLAVRRFIRKKREKRAK